MMDNPGNSRFTENNWPSTGHPAPEKPWTIKRLLDWIKDDFSKRGYENPRMEAEYLLGHLLDMERLKLYLQFDMPIQQQQRDKLREMVTRRRNGEPLQYITGKSGFRNLVLKVEPGVLIPRPETEQFVDLVLSLVALMKSKNCEHEQINILELGTGSGNIAISIVTESPDCEVWTVEISGKARNIAGYNINQHGVDNRVHLLEGSWYGPVKNLGHKFHMIVSNPPYIPRETYLALPDEVRKFEPREALDGGKQGIEYFPAIFQEGYRYLEQSGMIVTECDESHADSIIDLIRSMNIFSNVEKRQDLNGKDRFIIARL